MKCHLYLQRVLEMEKTLFHILLVVITRLLLASSQGDDPVTVMYKKRMQHIAEMNYVGVLNITHILDVGASDGYWTKFASSLFPSAEFFMIDGNPYLHKTLENTQSDFEIAVVGAEREKGRAIYYEVKKPQSSAGGEKDLTFDRDSDSDSDKTGDVMGDAGLTTTTIDDIVARRSLQPFQLLRFNLRGQEFAALQGASQTLQTTEFVLIEVPLHQYHPGAASLTDLNNFLTLRGFRMYDILDLRYSQPRTDMDVFYQVPTLVQFDVLWAKEESRVFSGVSYPPPPPLKYRLEESFFRSSPMSEDEKEGKGGEGKDFTKKFQFSVTKYPGGLAAVPLTSVPLLTLEEKSALDQITPITASDSVTKTYRRKRKKII